MATMREQASELRRSDGRQIRVLVVDDEPALSELLSMALRYEGWEVRTAADGGSAARAAREFRPDAVVLDVRLPDFDGFEWYRRRAGRCRRCHRRRHDLVETRGTWTQVSHPTPARYIWLTQVGSKPFMPAERDGGVAHAKKVSRDRPARVRQRRQSADLRHGLATPENLRHLS
jgi:DNA-binding NtrC family response regulator